MVERICIKFTAKTCLVHRSNAFECQDESQRPRLPWRTSSSAIAERPRDACSTSCCTNKRSFYRFAIRSWASVARSLCYSWDTCYSRLLYCFCYLIRIRHCWRKCVESAILMGWVTSRLILFLAHVYCSQTVAHLSYCWLLAELLLLLYCLQSRILGKYFYFLEINNVI